MRFRRPPIEELEVNLTPLIDVVFLLLIFFMVSTTFQKESQISLQLPRASNAETDTVPDSVEVLINAAGRFYVNEQELLQSDVGTLQSALFKLTNGKRDIPLTIRADGQTPHQAVVIAMDAAAKLGIQQLSIATSQDER